MQNTHSTYTRAKPKAWYGPQPRNSCSAAAKPYQLHAAPFFQLGPRSNSSARSVAAESQQVGRSRVHQQAQVRPRHSLLVQKPLAVEARNSYSRSCSWLCAASRLLRYRALDEEGFEGCLSLQSAESCLC